MSYRQGLNGDAERTVPPPPFVEGVMWLARTGSSWPRGLAPSFLYGVCNSV